MLKDDYSGLVSLFPDGAQTVFRAQENRTRRVTLLKGDLVGNTRTESRGVNARVMRKGMSGFASLSGLEADDAKQVIEAASENARFLADRAQRSAGYAAAGSGLITPARLIVDAPQKALIDAAKAVDAYIEKKYPELSSRRIVCYEDSMDKIIYSSDAASGHVTYPRCYIYIILNAETKDGVPVEVFKAFGGAGSFRDNFEDPAKLFGEADKLYEQLRAKQEGVYAEAGLKTVLIGGLLGGMLAHEAVGHTVEADLVLGGSVAGPSLGKRVASDLVSIVDYAHTAFGEKAPLPVYLDDEGVVAEDAVLIKDGFLRGYMNNRESALKFGVAPQGNARGWNFSDEPLIRMRNTCILPGRDKLEDMIASIDDGYYLLDSGNGQADLTGEFMFGVTMGYEIKNGKLGRALLDTTVTGIAFEMLKTVDMVSDTVTWSSSGFCGKKQPMPVGMGGPDIRCKIMIGGR